MVTTSDLTEKTILHVLDRSIPDLSGYSIRSKYILENQTKYGFKPFAVTSPTYTRQPLHEEINGIRYHRSSSLVKGLEIFLVKIPLVKEQRRMALLYKKILQIAANSTIDIIHAHSPSLCGLPALKAARKLNVPFIYEVRALWEDAAVDRKRFGEGSVKYRISRRLEQRIFDQADGLVCICEGLKNELALRADKKKIFVVQNGVDSSIFKPREKSLSIIKKHGLENKNIIGFIGSFFTFEGLSDLIQSIPLVLKKQKNVALLIVGGGVEETAAKELAREAGILDNAVIFIGRVPHEQIQDYYSVIDILVYPRISKRITELVTPLKPLEAMAMEKAVVASDVGGLKELVHDGKTGLLFQAGNVNDLAEKIVTLLRNDAQRISMGERARQDMMINREWSKIISRHSELYHYVLEAYV